MIEFIDVAKIYKTQTAVEDISFKIDDGEFVCLIGTSGSGKTTIMRMINRMTEPSKGKILIDGEDIMTKNPVQLRREIGYVIQQIGLLPHMTIYENITLVPALLKWEEERKRKIAEELIKKVDLPVEYLEKYPSQLSGGQQQRIGVIRALAAEQNIILMDEPFGALDPITRESLQSLIKNIQKELGKTVVFVTHDMNEAIGLADKILIMDMGHMVQYDTPENILKNPANDYVCGLLGEDNLNKAKTSYNSVETIMIKNPVFINEGKTTRDAIKLMRKKRVDTLFVTDAKNNLKGVVGIFELGKLGRLDTYVSEIMNEPASITNSTKIIEAIHLIVELGYRNLPVVDEKGKLVGIVTRASIVDSIYNNIIGGEADD
ncbi:ABC transporter ATP-binding protein [Aedoeadaptatus pacaensis]|uniref:ABC transporter ATP-binding protein n=1 Tax=Aedoeadaptatus pacaensis TaxID=1776390 RepID=UPI000837F679|nr:ABC transporter ATP-binding protein [Peptoniphilus pacaensis]